MAFISVVPDAFSTMCVPPPGVSLLELYKSLGRQGCSFLLFYYVTCLTRAKKQRPCVRTVAPKRNLSFLGQNPDLSNGPCVWPLYLSFYLCWFFCVPFVFSL